MSLGGDAPNFVGRVPGGVPCGVPGEEPDREPDGEAQSKDWAFLLLMIEAERKMGVGNAESAESAETLGDNTLCINDLSICLWGKFTIDKCLNC